MLPKLFIASSVESLDVAYAAQENLEHDVEATVWNQGIFDPSKFNLEALLDALQENDFAVFIISPDDMLRFRGDEHLATRDNVIFELGLFMGRIGRDRCFLISPRAIKDFHLPSDLMGLIHAEYNPDRQDRNIVAALGPACNKIRKVIREKGLLRHAELAIPAMKQEDRKTGVESKFYFSEPIQIESSKGYPRYISSDFLLWPECSVLFHLLLPKIGEGLRNAPKNKYIFAHNTGEKTKHAYENAFLFRYRKDKHWEFYSSNEVGGYHNMLIKDSLQPGWHQFLFTWNAAGLAIIINGGQGGILEADKDYRKYWPIVVADNISIGAWMPTLEKDTPYPESYIDTKIHKLRIYPEYLRASDTRVSIHQSSSER